MVETKKSGSLMVPIIIVLVFITTALTMVMSIRKSNALQYQILEDTYRMDIMLELSCLELHNAFANEQKGEELTYQIPTKLEFSQGVVEIYYDTDTKIKEIYHNSKLEKRFYQECKLLAQLANGRSKKTTYYIEVLPKKEEKTEYQLIE